jgi:ketosteroid isomerase-like protein
MSERRNVDIITRIYEAFGRGDIPAIIGQLTDDVRWSSHLEAIVPWHGQYKGKAEVLNFFNAIGQSVDVTVFAPQEFVAEGDTVVSLGDFACKVKATGKSSHTRWAFIWRLRDGKVYSYEQFHDPAIADAFRAS